MSPIKLKSKFGRSALSSNELPVIGKFWTVTQLAKQSGESTHSIRHYNRIGLLEPSQTGTNGYRYYDQAAIKRLQFIRNAQQLGFTLQEIFIFIQDARRGDAPCPQVRKILTTRLPNIVHELNQLESMVRRMSHAASQWHRHPDSPPVGDEICRLIESSTPLFKPKKKKGIA